MRISFFFSLVVIGILFSYNTANTTVAGCPTDVRDVYEARDMMCEGDCDAIRVVRYSEPEQVYFDSCQEGDTACSILGLNHYPACGGGYATWFEGTYKGVSTSELREQGRIGDLSTYIPVASFTNGGNNPSVTTSIGSTTLSFTLQVSESKIAV